MTLKELTHHFKLREQLAKDEEILKSLQAVVCPGAQIITDMPHTSGIKDKVGDLAIEITDMKEKIYYLQKKICHEEAKITAFIKSIEDDQTRMIFRLRFLHCLTWSEVAAVIGGRNTEDGVKSTCYRYLA